jgi:hypothetical protein
MHLGEEAATASTRMTLRDKTSHTTIGWYHEHTYSHYMRITNLQNDVTGLIWHLRCLSASTESPGPTIHQHC